MKANEVDFINLVQGAKQFQVPQYQRSYTWAKPQIEQLWADILEEAGRAKNAAAVAATDGHFLGSIVLAPAPMMAAGSVARWQIVDGQQRLMTMMIAMAALRDHVMDRDPTMAARIADEYLLNKWQQGDDRLRMLPSQRDRDSYTRLIVAGQSPQADEKVGAAYSILTDMLDDADSNGGPNVGDIEHVIRLRLRLVEIVASPADNVHRIFQTLNTTGQKLNQADLIRNHLFMLLPGNVDDIYRDHWLPIEKLIGEAGLETLLWLDLVLRGQDDIAQSDVYRAQARRLDAFAGDVGAVRAQVAGLERLARLYRLMIDPAREADLGLRRQLERLKDWGSQAAHPAILFMLDLRDRRVITPTIAATALHLMEGFLVRRMIAGVPTNNLGRIMNAVPRELSGSTTSVVDGLHEYLSAARRYWPTDGQLTDAIQTEPFYKNSKYVHRAFVLRRIADDYQGNETVNWQTARLSIEHVMPQSLTEEWRKSLKKEADRFGLGVDELHHLVVHTLGNLTLSGDNPVLSNQFILRKAAILSQSLLGMNQEIAAATAWDATIIARRGESLAARAIKLWPGPLASAAASATGPDWALLLQILAAMPAGRWTTFTDLAEAVGTHPVAIGNHLAGQRISANLWRVLMKSGRVPTQFRWDRTESPRTVLESEGVVFDRTGRARKDQRLGAAELVALVGRSHTPARPAR